MKNITKKRTKNILLSNPANYSGTITQKNDKPKNVILLKKIAFIFILLTSIIKFAEAQSYVALKELNVRSGPGTEYEIIDKISDGSEVNVTESGENWTKVVTSKGEYGYVSSKYLRTETASLAENKENKKENSIGTGGIIIGILFLIGVTVLIKWLKLKAYNLFGFRSNDGNTIYECYKCNETSMFKKKSQCPVGGFHDWTEV